MPDVMSLRDWLIVISAIFGGLGAAVAAIAVLLGRWRSQEDQAKDEYIETLKATNDELRAINGDLQKQNADLLERTSRQDTKIAGLVGKMSMLERLVLKVVGPLDPRLGP
jgi:cell division protein FtsB